MVEPSPLHQQVALNYSQSTGDDLLGSVSAALEVAGTDVSGELRYEGLRGVDHFHGGALAATRTLAKLGKLSAGEQVQSCAAGGPSSTHSSGVQYRLRNTRVPPRLALPGTSMTADGDHAP
jgi:hypothetical protein